MNINEKIYLARMVKNTSAKQLGTSIDVGEKAIYSWEKGESVDFDSIRKLASHFNMSLDYLVEDKPMTSNDQMWVKEIKSYQAEQETIKECDKLIEECKKYLDSLGCKYDDCILPSFKNGKIIYGAFSVGENGELSLDKKVLTEMKQAELLKKLFSNDISIDDAIKSDDKELIDIAFANYDRTANYYVVQKAKGLIKENMDYFGRRLESEDEIFFKENDLSVRLEKLDSNLKNYYYLIVCLIDRGAYYYKQYGEGDDPTVFYDIEDKSKTAFIYRVAKDMLLLRR